VGQYRLLILTQLENFASIFVALSRKSQRSLFVVIEKWDKPVTIQA